MLSPPRCSRSITAFQSRHRDTSGIELDEFSINQSSEGEVRRYSRVCFLFSAGFVNVAMRSVKTIDAGDVCAGRYSPGDKSGRPT
jgi:hypothetical protein